MNQFQIIKAQTPEIVTNYEVVKGELAEYLSRFKNVVVTEDNIGMCREIKKEVGDISKGIDRFRIDQKKALLAPINAFEAQCKELKQMADDIIIPITAGMKEFQEQARQEKISFARGWVRELAEAKGLPEELIARIEVKEEYGKSTISQKAVKADIENQILDILKAEEDKKRRLETFQTLIDIENESLNTKIDLSRFSRIIENAPDDKSVIQEIKYQADIIRTAEKATIERVNQTVEEPKAEPVKEQKEPPKANEVVDIEAAPVVSTGEFLVKVIQSEMTPNELLAFLKANGVMAVLVE